MSDSNLFWRSDSTQDESFELRKNYNFAGRFRLIELLGRGGFGQIWRVDDMLLNQEVALKISTCDLRTETLVLRRLPKDRYVSIFDYVTDENIKAFGYTMELLEEPWMTLDDYQKQCLLPSFRNDSKSIDTVRMVLYIGIDLLTTLDALHGRKYGRSNRWCHADIKPVNVYINQKLAKIALKVEWGNPLPPFTKIGDLGLACKAGQNLFAGTKGFMAPEQQESGPASPATDLFAVGQTIASMVFGRPFDQDELRHITRMKTKLSQHIPSAHLVEKISEIIRKMTQSTPPQRGNAHELMRLMRQVLVSQDDWRILTMLTSSHMPAQGYTLNEAAEILFDTLAPYRRWRKRNSGRYDELKTMVNSLYKRQILSRNGYKYSVRV